MTTMNVDTEPRCKNCNKLLAEMTTRPWIIRCGRCGKRVVSQFEVGELVPAKEIGYKS